MQAYNELILVLFADSNHPPGNWITLQMKYPWERVYWELVIDWLTVAKALAGAHLLVSPSGDGC